ncbi:Uncharacterised protein [Serratia ficaria]|nr:Uncharacterised protein [Serratia ficaria]CAI1194252.1 Uncharacterised protein [Serratia ficaria]CAI1205436.1 Uncharacterised protein [Serratia ficaria]CAI2107344.1 Uncharacterised protein [Serratia ficaria]CAI2444658.1 Uncharacterised protein [Serratia ficaria]
MRTVDADNFCAALQPIQGRFFQQLRAVLHGGARGQYRLARQALRRGGGVFPPKGLVRGEARRAAVFEVIFVKQGEIAVGEFRNVAAGSQGVVVGRNAPHHLLGAAAVGHHVVEATIEHIALRGERNQIKTKGFFACRPPRQRRVFDHPAVGGLFGVGVVAEIEAEQGLMGAWRAVLVKLTVSFHKMRLQGRRFFDNGVDGLPQQPNVERPVDPPIPPNIERQVFGDVFPQPKLALGGGYFMQLIFFDNSRMLRLRLFAFYTRLFVHNIL